MLEGFDFGTPSITNQLTGRLQPDDAEAFSTRGNVRRAKGDLEGALQDFCQAIRLKPSLAEVFETAERPTITVSIGRGPEDPI